MFRDFLLFYCVITQELHPFSRCRPSSVVWRIGPERHRASRMPTRRRRPCIALRCVLYSVEQPPARRGTKGRERSGRISRAVVMFVRPHSNRLCRRRCPKPNAGCLLGLRARPQHPRRTGLVCVQTQRALSHKKGGARSSAPEILKCSFNLSACLRDVCRSPRRWLYLNRSP